jgi:hypothetical protein
VVRSSVANRVSAIATLFLLTTLSSSPSFAQISQQAMQQCSALSNSVRRVTCYDLLTQLRVTEPSETTGQGEGVMMRLHSELMSKLDVWIEAQPEPRPSKPEAIRRLLEPALQSQ